MLLCSEPILALYDPNREHELHTDDSSEGLAGILLQRDDEGGLRVVYYYSRQCTEAEKLYHSFELEVLAIVESLERFRVYLLGKHFRIVTDCSAVSSSKNTKPLVPRIARWFLKLQEYDFELVHRAADKIPHADSLSRAPYEDPKEPKIVAEHILKIEVTQDDWLNILQMQDPKLKTVRQVLKGELHSEQGKQIKKEYEYKNNRLYRRDGSELKFVLPATVRGKMLQLYHDQMGHYGVEKTLQRLRQDFWFPGMRKFTKQYVAVCLQCCYNKSKGGKTEGELHVDECIPIPFATLHIDHLGLFPKSKRQNNHLIVAVDAFSKFVVVRAVRNAKTQPVINLLNELTAFFGLPKRIVTDRGTAFTSHRFEQYCRDNHI
ncbi:Transposon Ty3-G Gag-Pol polyprotein [Anthophora plagiata]